MLDSYSPNMKTLTLVTFINAERLSTISYHNYVKVSFCFQLNQKFTIQRIIIDNLQIYIDGSKKVVARSQLPLNRLDTAAGGLRSSWRW